MTSQDDRSIEAHAAASDSESARGSTPPLAQLRWRCRRGMRELDVLLERYLQVHYADAPEGERRAFAALLELQDPQLFALLMRREVPADPEWANVLAKLTGAGP